MNAEKEKKLERGPKGKVRWIFFCAERVNENHWHQGKGQELAPLAKKVNAAEKKELMNITGTTSGKGKELAPLAIRIDDDSQLDCFCAIFSYFCL